MSADGIGLIAVTIGVLLLALLVQWLFASPEREQLRSLKSENAMLRSELLASATRAAQVNRERDAVVTYARRPV